LLLTNRNAYGFRIVNDTQGKKIVLEVSSLPEMEVIDSSVYWTYHDLEQCLLTKLKALFFVYADSDMLPGYPSYSSPYRSSRIVLTLRGCDGLLVNSERKVEVCVRLLTTSNPAKSGPISLFSVTPQVILESLAYPRTVRPLAFDEPQFLDLTEFFDNQILIIIVDNFID